MLLLRKDVLAGLMFIAVAALGLYLSRNYPVGSMLRMGTGYVPRLLCWLLLVLGLIVALSGLLARGAEIVSEDGSPWRPLIFVPASLLAFALAVERFGLVVGATLLIVVGATAGRDSRIGEVVVTAVVLVAACVGIFIWGLALPIQTWPEW
jgi:putative tricarboxylic transport membrane protein